MRHDLALTVDWMTGGGRLMMPDNMRYIGPRLPPSALATYLNGFDDALDLKHDIGRGLVRQEPSEWRGDAR